MANIFDSIRLKRPGRSTFNKSFNNKFTANIGQLVPTLSMNVLGGDRVKIANSYFLRLQPLLKPIMHKVDVKNYFFFIPNRLLSGNWERFITGGRDMEIKDNILSLPHFSSLPSDYSEDIKFNYRLLDYLGFPNSALPNILEDDDITFPTPIIGFSFLAYWRVIYDYFLNEDDLELRETIESALNYYYDTKDDEVDTLTDQFGEPVFYVPFFKLWSKDYFTSALTTPQRGTAINLPFDVRLSGDNQQIVSTGTVYVDTNAIGSLGTYDTGSGGTQLGVYDQHVDLNPETPNYGHVEDTEIGRAQFSTHTTSVETLNALLQRISVNSSFVNIEQLREALLLQEFAERSNVAGYRYFEWLTAHFGIKTSDARLQRAEFLGSVSRPISFVEVEQNSESTANSPQGNLSGKALSGDANFICDFIAPEHGIILGLTVIQPKAAYYQGFPRKLIVTNPFDYPLPEFAHLGEQPIYNMELFYEPGTKTQMDAWGYQSRYADFKSAFDEIHGEFRSSLDLWHAAREFKELQPLNLDFLSIKPTDFDRLFAVQSSKADQALFDMDYKISHTTSLPKYGTPKLL